MPKITVVLDYVDTSGEALFPVSGRSGRVWAYAQFCPKRGNYCVRMTPEEFREARADLFTAKRNTYYPIPDFEIEDDEIPATPAEGAPETDETLQTVAPLSEQPTKRMRVRSKRK
jgi:hypothetical protein